MSDTTAKNERSSWVPTNPNYDPSQPMQIGGQAVIEGVMMRAPGSVATAVRRANGEIVVQQLTFHSWVERLRLKKTPILRGAIGLIDMMYLGIKTLNWSAEIAMLDEEAKNAPAGDNGKEVKPKGQTQLMLIGTLVFALAMGVGIFFVTPLFLATHLFQLEQKAFEFNLVAGLIRITILLGYLAAISMMQDIKRLFQYHGAEHKSVFAFELNGELIPPEVQKFSRFHPRCGTSFLLIVMFVAILSFSVLDLFLIEWLGEMTLLIRLATHIPFIPVVGGIAYEFIKFSAKHSTTAWGRVIIAPGLWLQKITTKEPDHSQIEVALVALKCALGIENAERYVWKPLVAEQQPVSEKASTLN